MIDSLQETHSSLRTLERFREVNRTFPRTTDIEDHKSQGKKVFGWFCTYVPEEILHAAGALPVRITGCSKDEDLEEGTTYLYVNNCSFSRSCMQLGIRGEYSFLDGVIGGSTCDGARRLFDVWRQYIPTPFQHVLTVPRKHTEAAHELYHRQVVQLKEHLEDFLGLKIGDDGLRRSIDILNESRGMLHKLYDLRKRDQPPITGAETLEVCNAS